MLTRGNKLSKVGTHPYIRKKKGANPVQSLLEVVEIPHYAHLRRNMQKGRYICGVKEVNSSRSSISPFTVGSRQKVGSNNQLGGI